MKKITEKYYIGAYPKNLDKTKFYVLSSSYNDYVRWYYYSDVSEGWLLSDGKPLTPGTEQARETNHDVATRLNATVNPRFQSFLHDEAYEIEPEELEKFILIKKLVK